MDISIFSIICFVIAAICLFVAVYTFISFNIPNIIRELNGKTTASSNVDLNDNAQNNTSFRLIQDIVSINTNETI